MKTRTSAPTSSPLNADRSIRQLLSILCMSTILACGFASAAMADAAAPLPEVLLASGSVTLPEAEALLIRTAMTPSAVELNVPIGMQRTVCAEYAQVPHTGQNGAKCGYDRLVRRVCRDIPGECHVIDQRTGRKACAPTRRECANESIAQARVCTWMETECVRTEIAESSELRKVQLKFKNVASLAAGETETYELRGAQTRLDGTDAAFALSAIATKRSVKIKAKDGLFTGFKDVITIKGK
jgi:hypothetical protein